MIRRNLSISVLAVCLTAGCASQPHEGLSVEHKGKVTILHHRTRTRNGALDRIEAIAANGTVTAATIEVFDVGRLPDGHGGMREASRYYRIAESEHWNTNLPSGKQIKYTGPKTVFTPPNYSPPPKDQRINDAVAEAKEAKKKLDDARNDIEKRLAEDNNLRGELQQVQEQNQQLTDQLSAAMNTPKRQKLARETDAQKAAESATAISELQKWRQQVNNGGMQP
jgi:hypothetical protein